MLEFYGELLTKKQKEYITLYYADDYSLGEISEEFSVSRQAVYDNIKRTTKILEDYEERLKLLQDFDNRNKQLDNLVHYVQEHYKDDHTLWQLVSELEQSEEG